MVDRERNQKIYDLIEMGYDNKYIARKVGETSSNISVIRKRLQKLGKEKFINNYRKNNKIQRRGILYIKTKAIPDKQVPRFKVGDVIFEKFEIIQIFENTSIMYLTKHIMHGYKKCFFDDDIIVGGNDEREQNL